MNAALPFLKPGDMSRLESCFEFHVEYVASACLAACTCRYDGHSLFIPEVYALWQEGKACLICPECLGGLTVPRLPCELRRGEVWRRDGRILSTEFRLGVRRALQITRLVGAQKAIVKSRSPSCGCGQVYDGTFSHTLCQGNGLWTTALLAEGLRVITEEEFTGSFR